MVRTFVYSDPHFYHKNIVKFTNYDGSKVRPWDCHEKMTNQMIDWYNELVDDNDRVYLLGDIAFTVNIIRSCLERMKGRKVLVPGNHDPKKLKKYIDLFDDVRGYVQRDGFIMSHIPLHPHCLGRWKLNIHGHLHSNEIGLQNHEEYSGADVDLRYYNASVERTNFRPILLDDILKERGLR